MGELETRIILCVLAILGTLSYYELNKKITKINEKMGDIIHEQKKEVEKVSL